jgi:membrane associated rhomboid family serine protease
MIPLRDNIISSRFPFVNWAILLGNCYVFFIELTLKGSGLEAFINQWAVIPAQFLADPSGQWFTLVTATFLHGGWMHIIGNMLFLHIFGDNVEDQVGHFRYPIFYVMVGVLANLVQIYFSPHSKLPLVGASGAIAGVLGAYFFFHPYARIMTLIPLGFFSRIVHVPAFIFLGLWFVIQAIQSTASLGVKTMQDVGGVAWWAHASGFISGLLLGPVFSLSKGKGRKRTERSTWNT